MYQNEKKNYISHRSVLQCNYMFSVFIICMTCLVYLIMIICEFNIYGLMCGVAFDMLLIEINLRFSFPLAGAFLQSSAGRRCWGLVSDPSSHTMASTLPEHCWMERP